MANKFKNEKLIKLGEVEILLRPTFEACANLEGALGYGLPQMAFDMAKSKMPTLTDMGKVIFFCQAEQKFTMEEIWQIVMDQGIGIATEVLGFVGQLTAGDKAAAEISEATVKKNH